MATATSVEPIRISYDPFADWYPWQRQCWNERKRFNLPRKARRTGGSAMCEDIACMALFDGLDVGWFSATNKILADSERKIAGSLDEFGLLKTHDKTRSFYQLLNDAKIEMWSFEGKLPGRAREYGLVVIDEGAHIQGLLDFFNRNIRPGLARTGGSAWFPSSPNGRSDHHTLWMRGQDQQEWPEWASWIAPMTANPDIPREEIEAMRHEMDDFAFRQEVLAEIVARAGAVFPHFDRGIHAPSNVRFDPRLPVHAGIDFGFRTMAAVFFQIVSGSTVQVIDAVEFKGMQTEAACIALSQRLLGANGSTLSIGQCLDIIGCDPAGDSRSPSTEAAGRTDVSILRQCFPQARVKFTTNPKHRNVEWGCKRIRALMRSAAGDVRFFVHPRCSALINPIEGYHYPDVKEGRPEGQDPVKDGINDHMIDALRYGLVNVGVLVENYGQKVQL